MISATIRFNDQQCSHRQSWMYHAADWHTFGAVSGHQNENGRPNALSPDERETRWQSIRDRAASLVVVDLSGLP
jgi:hypothetical protein